MPRVASTPYAFPLNGQFDPPATALLVIDMQVDFCGPGGYMDAMGFDLGFLRGPIAPIQAVLAAFRARRLPVLHTREAFAPDLSDVQPHRLWRSPGAGVVVGDLGLHGRCLIHGEPCWEIIPELAPAANEAVFDKPGYGAFGTTNLDNHLKQHGIKNLVLVGLTTDCCIQTSLREALDRGYDCLTLQDCTAAATPQVHETAIRGIARSSGIFGALASSQDLLAALA